jgi:hypothetical protein
MKIEKNGCVYDVTEKKSVWELTSNTGKVSVAYQVSKTDCPTLEDLKEFFCKDGD